MSSTIFATTNIRKKSCFFNIGSSIISQEVGLSYLFLTLFFTFYVGFGSKSGSGTVMFSGSGTAKAKSCGSCGSGSAKAKSYGSCGSGSTTLRMSAFY
jgi:hypothetical protein